MTVKIDADACTDCGLCADSVDAVFVMGDEIAEVVKSDVPSDLEDDVRDMVENCPVEAIIIE